MKVLFYITQFEQVKDATKVYLETINKALTGNKQLVIVSKLDKVKDVDYVVTFTVTDFLKLKLRKPNVKIINWFQGVIPEEVKLKTNNKKQYFIFSLLERFALKFSYFNFFVSKEMRNHYWQKYNYKKKNYIVMPCFNATLLPKTIITTKNYQEPTFVYIGSMAKWQCVDRICNVFKLVKEEIQTAELTILTGQQEEAKELCSLYNIKASIRYVSLSELSTELVKYKYGFLLRDDITVNNVATPTKMSTYLASGVIPIYSEVIKDFSAFNDLKFVVRENKKSEEEIAKEIIAFEKKQIDTEQLFEEYKIIFENYYSESKYIKKIKETLR